MKYMVIMRKIHLKIKVDIRSAIAILLIMGFDWLIQYINILQSNNVRRLITGTLGGIG